MQLPFEWNTVFSRLDRDAALVAPHRPSSEGRGQRAGEAGPGTHDLVPGSVSSRLPRHWCWRSLYDAVLMQRSAVPAERH